MKKWSVYTLLLIQGLVHFFAFLKAFVLFPLVEINSNIPREEGLLWLLASGLFFVSAIFFLQWQKLWPGALILGIIVSQLLVLNHWEEARLLTVTNILLLVIVLIDIVVHPTKPSVPRGYVSHSHKPVHHGSATRHINPQRRVVQH
jgi:hypothetical protein